MAIDLNKGLLFIVIVIGNSFIGNSFIVIVLGKSLIVIVLGKSLIVTVVNQIQRHR